MPKCNHDQKMDCGIDPENFICQIPCSKILSCGHRCSAKCGEPCPSDKCTVKVRKQCSYCNGYHEVMCKDLEKDLPCTSPCETVLSCGHKCVGTYSECHNKVSY